MRTRIGIELSPIDCRIVEIGVSGHAETRVISYSISPRASAETRVQLARLQGRQAAVVVWGTRGDHRQAIVNADDYNSMRREALNSLQSAGVDTYGALTDIAPAGPRARANGRRPVVMAIASKSDVSAAVRPLVAAGIKIKSIVTPAIALGSLARLRCGGGALHGVEAYVALEQSATCLTLVRNQLLVAARELPWGYVDEHEPVGDAVPRDKFATRLSAELVDFFADAGIDANAVNVCICGSLPGLRTMTAAIVERLDVEIEPLDSLFGIDVDRLPPGAELCERAVELRLAWAVATDWKAPLNLLRDRQRQATAAVLAQAAVVAGIGAGVTLGWGLRQTSWLERATHVPTTFKRMSVRPKIQLPTVVDMSPDADRAP